MTITVHSAKTSDIWPDGSGHTPDVEAEIIEIARSEITADDVARSGLVFSQWYIPYYLAEGRWRQRQAHQAEQKQRAAVTESANARKIAGLEKRVAKLTRNFNEIGDVLGTPANDPKAEPLLFNVIRTLAWDLIHEKRVLRDVGIWDSDKLYGQGAAITDKGALWICQREHKGERPPGETWRLAVKSDVSELRSLVRDAVRDELRKQKGQ